MIYIASPTGIATGGTELLQQLCFCLNNNRIPAKMLYYGEYYNSPVALKFNEYNNPYILREEFNCVKGDILIVPETSIGLVYKESKVLKKYIWWLSVDNYSMFNPQNAKMKVRAFMDRMVFNRCLHLVQSEYARLYLENDLKIKKQRTYYLSDYLNQEYIDRSINALDNARENNILYNPRKGFEFTKKIIKAIPEYNWIPLQGYSNQELHKLFSTSKVYIDFGHHPGKDRIPREAAICGCCIITGRKGAAYNDIDVPILNEFKFLDSESSIEDIHKKIIECMNNYNEEAKKFAEYISIIKSEKERFEKDVINVFGDNK